MRLQALPASAFKAAIFLTANNAISETAWPVAPSPTAGSKQTCFLSAFALRQWRRAAAGVHAHGRRANVGGKPAASTA